MKLIPSLHVNAQEEDFIIIRTCTKVRVKEFKDPLGGLYYMLERKNWLGLWYRPSVTQKNDSIFCRKEEVLKWFYWYKSGKKGLLQTNTAA